MAKYWSSSEEYEIVFTVAEFATEAQVDDLAGRFRPVLVKLEDNECGMLSIGTAVCAAHAIGDDLYRFYDAIIEAVKIFGGGRCNVTNGHCNDNVENIQEVIKNCEDHFSICMAQLIPCHGFWIMG
ncbi:hypothetical protein ACS0TY_020240 [Phlomoides rotata]